MNILLVCTGNTCRSPMAAAMLRQILREYGADLEQFHIVTAGLAAASGWPASPGAVYAMQLQGLDISEHRSQAVNRDLVESRHHTGHDQGAARAFAGQVSRTHA